MDKDGQLVIDVFKSISSFKDPMLAMMNYSSNTQIENSKYNNLTYVMKSHSNKNPIMCLPQGQHQDLYLRGSVQQHLSLSYQPEKAIHITSIIGKIMCSFTKSTFLC